MQASDDFFPIESVIMSAQDCSDPDKEPETVLLKAPTAKLLRGQLPRNNKGFSIFRAWLWIGWHNNSGKAGGPVNSASGARSGLPK